MRIIEKSYSKDKNKFVIKREKDDGQIIVTEYSDFYNFYRAASYDLNGADLYDYDFENVDLIRYNLQGAKTNPSIKEKLISYNQSLYQSICEDSNYCKMQKNTDWDNASKSLCCHDKMEYNDNNLCFCYISDLHLDIKLLKKYQQSFDIEKAREYLAEKINELKESIPKIENVSWEESFNPYEHIKILIIGDVACDFEIYRMFFYAYKSKIANPTFVVLGNHELWDNNLFSEFETIDAIIAKYREFLFSIGVTLLENQLFLPLEKQPIMCENELLNMDSSELQTVIERNPYAIFGGIGYAGLNDDFNCDNGIYRQTLTNRENEKELSKRVEALYKKISRTSRDCKVIWVTHMPKEDWTDEPYNPKWLYLSGHTHRNFFKDDENLHLYADNQIGYENLSFGFKQFWISPFENLFGEKQDGIYEITAAQYLYFYRAIGKSITFNRAFSKLYMIKKQGNYCFLMKTEKSDELKLLAGGQIRNTGHKDIEYFFDNLNNYVESIAMYMKKYNSYQKKIAEEVCSFGGWGYIHGCIIDIDYFNHIYLNPLDGTITPYYATDMTAKYVYPNVESLLMSQRQELYEKLIAPANKTALVHLLNHNAVISSDKVYVEDTSIYRISRIISELQYTTRDRIVRVWYKGILENPTEENGKEIIEHLLLSSGQENE